MSQSKGSALGAFVLSLLLLCVLMPEMNIHSKENRRGGNIFINGFPPKINVSFKRLENSGDENTSLPFTVI